MPRFLHLNSLKLRNFKGVAELNDSSATNPNATTHSSNSSKLPTGHSEPSSAPT